MEQTRMILTYRKGWKDQGIIIDHVTSTLTAMPSRNWPPIGNTHHGLILALHVHCSRNSDKTQSSGG